MLFKLIPHSSLGTSVWKGTRTNLHFEAHQGIMPTEPIPIHAIISTRMRSFQLVNAVWVSLQIYPDYLCIQYLAN